MKPLIERGAKQPSNDCCRGKNKSKLAVSRNLHQRVLLFWVVVSGGHRRTLKNLAAYLTRLATRALCAMPSDQFTPRMNRSGSLPITRVATAGLPSPVHTTKLIA